MSRPADHAYDAAEPIAVVGMGMRFPGGSHSSEQFWDMLSKGRSAFGKIPKERFNADGYYHPDSARAGSVCCPRILFACSRWISLMNATYVDKDQYQG